MEKKLSLILIKVVLDLYSGVGSFGINVYQEMSEKSFL